MFCYLHASIVLLWLNLPQMLCCPWTLNFVFYGMGVSGLMFSGTDYFIYFSPRPKFTWTTLIFLKHCLHVHTYSALLGAILKFSWSTNLLFWHFSLLTIRNCAIYYHAVQYICNTVFLEYSLKLCMFRIKIFYYIMHYYIILHYKMQ